MASENIVTGKKYRILKDATQKVWDVISFWTKAKDVEFNDGQNAETKVGSIQGITSGLTTTSSNIAASASAVKELNDKITQLNSDININPDELIINASTALQTGYTAHYVTLPENKWLAQFYTKYDVGNANGTNNVVNGGTYTGQAITVSQEGAAYSTRTMRIRLYN